MNDLDKENRYLKAKERVAAEKKFYTSLMSYFVFILFLAGINYYTDKLNYPWFLWAAFGWGIGLVFQAIKVFGYGTFFSTSWEERKIKEYMNEDKKNDLWK
ncbi:2TM domain-containing protein [uncultured Maribacter sp.]|uniref:2TM domain-containing protein n=1 Tax=uncultured Maribacter sp. TaxID=431308 RepID=UPI00261B112E|nr:2TM domain-containing protein [uncultured Maribacter sp.]